MMSDPTRDAGMRALRGWHLSWSSGMRGHDHPVEECRLAMFADVLVALSTTPAPHLLRDALDSLAVGGPINHELYVTDPTYHAMVEVWRRAPELDETRRLLGYLWTAEGKIDGRPVSGMFDEDDPIVADVERLATFPLEGGTP